MAETRRFRPLRRRLMGAVGALVVLILAFFIVSNGRALRQGTQRTIDESLRNQYQRTLQTIRDKSWSAYSLAEWTAAQPEIREAFAARDRERLQALTLPVYEEVKRDIQVDKFQFHLPPATSFLRVHKIGKYGDDLTAIRPTIVHTNETQTPTLGLDEGAFGFGIRGLVPVYHQGEHIGSVEFGMAVADGLIEPLIVSEDWAMAITVPDGEGGFAVQAETEALEFPAGVWRERFRGILETNETAQCRGSFEGREQAYLLAPLRDYADNAIGVLVIRRDIADLTAAQTRSTLALLLGGAAGLILVLLILRAMMGRMVTRPLEQVMGTAKKMMGEKDFSHKVARKGGRTTDELDQIALIFNDLTDQFSQVLAGVQGQVSDLLEASENLRETAGNLEEEAAGTGEKSQSVAAAEQMNANTEGVASGMEQTSSNLSNVAASAEEMNATIGEITSNTNRGRETTGRAVEQVREVSEVMGRLGEAAGEIDKVTASITEISAQTNLLALNATIEAARAGAAGKGFGVVANEIKELAQQTAVSSGDIKERIHAIQETVQQSVSNMESIRQVMDEVDEVVVSVAAAMEEQSTTARDIAGNISQASQGVEDASGKAEENAQVSRNIAGEIAGVSQAVEAIRGSSDRVNGSAQALDELARKLKELADQYRLAEG